MRVVGCVRYLSSRVHLRRRRRYVGGGSELFGCFCSFLLRRLFMSHGRNRFNLPRLFEVELCQHLVQYGVRTAVRTYERCSGGSQG